MKIRSILLAALMLLAPIYHICGQVTIGSHHKPEQGAILDIKENNNDGKNSDKGLGIPRVILSNLTELYPMYGSYGAEKEEYTQNKTILKQKHAGLTVYNVNENDPNIPSGFYLWDGERWFINELIATPPPVIDNLMCDAVRFYPTTIQAGVPFRCVILLPYTGGNGGRYSQFDSGTYITGIQNSVPIDFKVNISEGQLAFGNGELILIGEGTIPSATDPIFFDINIFGKSCTFVINEQTSDIKTLEYRSATFLGVTESSTTTGVVFDNIEIRYNNGYYEYRLLNERRDVSLIYRKVGSGGMNYGIYAQNYAIKDKWYKIHDSENGQPVKAGSGSNGNKADNANISLQNRDFATLHLIIHASKIQDVYRVTFNANRDIAEDATRNVPAAKSAISIIIEKLE